MKGYLAPGWELPKTILDFHFPSTISGASPVSVLQPQGIKTQNKCNIFCPHSKLWLSLHKRLLTVVILPSCPFRDSELTAQGALLGHRLKYFRGKRKPQVINIGRKTLVSFGFQRSPLQLLCYSS